MTTILNLPEEILRLIFEELQPDEHKICQEVCKAWYLPAHILVLKEIHIPFRKIQRFNSSIDCNPDPIYLNAVKSITIVDKLYTPPPMASLIFGKEMIRKTLYRFPNLKDVKLVDFEIAYKEFDDEVCKKILDKCPRLDKFEVRMYHSGLGQDYYLNAHYKLRLLLTRLDLVKVNFRLRPESALEFISNFPRLKTICGVPNLNKFEKLLSVLGQLRNVQSIEMGNVLDDQENFAENCISPRAIDEQEQLVKSLSSIKMLNLSYQTTFGENSIKFMATYFTGLHSLTIKSYDNRNLTSVQEILLKSTIIDLLCSAKKYGRIDFYYFRLTDLSKYISAIVTKLFQNTLSSKVLELKVTTEPTDIDEFVYLVMESDRRESLRKVTINGSMRPSLQNIATYLCSKLSPTNGIETLIIGIDNNYNVGYDQGLRSSMYYELHYVHSQAITTSMYDEILSAMPSLKEVHLEIPSSYVHHPSIAVYPSIEKVRLQATAGEQSQVFIDTFFDRFPNVKHLNLYYFCGTWNKDLHEYQLDLGNSLKSLTFDITPVRFRLESKVIKNGIEPFIVLQVVVASSNVKHLYKISMYGRKSEISEKDLISFMPEEEYYRIHVTVNSLERLDVYMCLWSSTYKEKYTCLAENEKRILIFDNTK